MTTGAKILIGALLIAGVGVLVGAETAAAQTGPGGVGTDDGTSDLQLWMRADNITGLSDGAFVNTWPDASGYGYDATQSDDALAPVYRSSGRNGRPTVEFGGPDGSFDGTADEMKGTFTTATGDDATYFVVGNNQNDTRKSNGTKGRRAFADFSGSGTDTRIFINETVVNYYDGSDERTGGSIATGDYVLFDITHTSSGAIEGQLFGDAVIGPVNGNTKGLLKNYILGNDNTSADNLDGNLAEVVVFDRILNEAERLVVRNYLSSKYDLAFSTAANDKYAYDGTYGFDVAGIGRETSSDAHLSSNSSLLNISATSFGGDDRYVFVGHDDGEAASFGFEATEPVNGFSGNAERMAREWRADVSGVATKTVTVSIESTDLPARSDAGYEYLLFVDSGNAFNTSPVAYTLQDDGSGTLKADVELSDGDYLTIGAGRRVVSFDAATTSVFENTADTPNLRVYATLNLPYPASTGTSVDVAFTDTGDLNGNGTIEDTGTGNGNGNYEARATDYNVDTASPATISAGSSTATLDVTVNNDGDTEQTEKFKVSLDGATTNAAPGSPSTITVSINDDDNPRDLQFASTSASENEGNGGGAGTTSLTVDLAQDGDGETGATAVPYTQVEFAIDTGASTATIGTDLSDPTVDVRIFGESGSAGNEFQERLTPTTGRVHFASGASSASLKLEVNQDAINEDNETVVLTLKNPVSAGLSGSNGQLTLTLTNDDTAPTVQFAQSSSGGVESTSGSVEVTPSAIAGNTVTVDFGVDTETTTDPEASTATEGSDFSLSPSGGTLTFAPGETSQTIDIAVTDDTQEELDETVVLDLSSAANATLQTPDSHTYTVTDNDEPNIGASGPGGVGATDGEGRLIAWLPADQISGLAGGDPVDTWADQSGNGFDATQSGSSRPTYRETGPNGQPVVQFIRNDLDEMTSTSPSLSFEQEDAEAVTFFAVGNEVSNVVNGNDRQAFAEFNGSGTDVRLFVDKDNNDNNRLRYFHGGGNVIGSTVGRFQDGDYILYDATHVADGSGNSTIDLRLDGTTVGTTTEGNDNNKISSYILGDDNTNGDELDGNLAEVIYFNTELSETRRILVQNYLAAKYGLSLDTGNGATDVYAGDESSNGDYDRGVFGIGRETVNDFHTAAETDGLRFDNPSGLGDGDYLMAGHRVGTNAVNTGNVGGVTGLKARMERNWYWDTNGGSPTVDVTFDLSKAGFPSVLNLDPSGYVLLFRSGQTGNWTSVSSSASVANGDEITFSGVDAGSQGTGYYTLGTTDKNASPLSGTALIVTGASGNEGTAANGTLGGDAGWRMIGPPVSGATAADITSGVRNPFVLFNLAVGNQLFEWDDTQGSGPPGDWVALSSGDAFESGRGHLLFLFDDDEAPLAPDLTLDMTAGSVPDTSTDQTVSSLNQDAQFHVLANPFNRPFDLTSVQDPGNNSLGSGNTDFSATVQIWDGGATTAEDNAEAGSYVDVTANTSANAGAGAMATSGDVVSPWQGFVVQRTAALGTGATELTFASGGTTDGTRTIVGSKAQNEAEPAYTKIGLKLTVSDGGTQVARDEAASVFFHSNATGGFDAFDASKLDPLARTYAVIGPVGTVRGDSTAMKAVESRPADVEGEIEIPMQLRTTGDVSGTARVTAPDWTGVPDSWTVTLVDTKSTPDPADDESVTLSPSAASPAAAYTFALSETGAKTAASRSDEETERTRPATPPSVRTLPPTETTAADTSAKSAKSEGEGEAAHFRLRIEPNGAALPVEMAEMQVRSEEQRAVLSWTTASEQNNAGFHVEHQRLPAADTTAAPTEEDWQQLTFVKGSGTTSKSQTYRHETGTLGFGRHTFRLRQVDTDGTETVTEPVETEVRLRAAYAVEAPYPNPARTQATLPVTVKERQPVTVEVYDVLGRRIQTVHDGELPAQNTTYITLPTQSLTSGAYFVRIRGEAFTATKRMTVIK